MMSFGHSKLVSTRLKTNFRCPKDVMDCGSGGGGNLRGGEIQTRISELKYWNHVQSSSYTTKVSLQYECLVNGKNTFSWISCIVLFALKNVLKMPSWISGYSTPFVRIDSTLTKQALPLSGTTWSSIPVHTIDAISISFLCVSRSFELWELSCLTRTMLPSSVSFYNLYVLPG